MENGLYVSDGRLPITKQSIPLDTRLLSEVIDTAVVSKHFRLLAEFDIIIDFAFHQHLKYKFTHFASVLGSYLVYFRYFISVRNLELCPISMVPASIQCWRYKMAKWREGSQENKRKTLKQHG